MMTKRSRVEAVLAGSRPDRPPVSFWHHFAPPGHTGQPAVEAHLRHLEAFDLDFLKVMNDHPYPREGFNIIRTVADLARIRPLPADHPGFTGQYEVLSRLARALGPDVLMCTTVFNPWATLRYLVAPPSDVHGPPKLAAQDERDQVITALLREDRAAVKAAVAAIAESLAGFAAGCIRAGAHGVFLSVRDDWVNTRENGPDTYDEICRSADLAILGAAASGTFNMLHICGRAQNFKAFADYPVDVINWADRTAGPSIAYARDRVKPAIAGGVDNLRTLPEGLPEDCAAEVRDALRQAGTRPILITAGCTYDPEKVPRANLEAVVEAARAGP